MAVHEGVLRISTLRYLQTTRPVFILTTCCHGRQTNELWGGHLKIDGETFSRHTVGLYCLPYTLYYQAKSDSRRQPWHISQLRSIREEQFPQLGTYVLVPSPTLNPDQIPDRLKNLLRSQGPPQQSHLPKHRPSVSERDRQRRRGVLSIHIPH